ncbi:MAG: tRNA (adenosine(37)-N6)-threonylcarbamoyltransferase complex dimerization subunit type 1 TsaB [Scytolyngbya sp. HA4215-MV1]|jgi:tRNA threonylcarbamoyl adenosine modification protein YeaZ|nr:tRNA (adenosine(37)-N6)-threonylcarbamoyltransferase complex dimerization subunit type 1 TsaB [Scytolyngbya sp. HA4215-MV1]
MPVSQDVAFNPKKYALAIHTASPELGLALNNFAGEACSQIWHLGRDLSTHLQLHLAEFIQPQHWQDLAFLAVAKGPGGFTGTRMGVVAARTLAQQLEIPLFAISTLAAIADSHYKTLASPIPPSSVETIAVQMQAQRGEIYAAIYQVSPIGVTPHLADSVLTPEAWQQILTSQPPNHLVKAEDNLGATVVQVLELAFLAWQRGDRPHWSEAIPFYGQHPVTLST